VPISAKVLPFLTLGYLLMPFDFLPDALLGLGQVDDIVILMVGLRMFISLSPPDVVAEYQRLVGRRQVDEAVWSEPEREIIELEPQVLEEDNEG
jgi:uncharacterized membrane protein YkvA (DUF1232 family)